MPVKLTFWKNLASDALFKDKRTEVLLSSEHEFKFAIFMRSQKRWLMLLLIWLRHSDRYLIIAGP